MTHVISFIFCDCTTEKWKKKKYSLYPAVNQWLLDNNCWLNSIAFNFILFFIFNAEFSRSFWMENSRFSFFMCILQILLLLSRVVNYKLKMTTKWKINFNAVGIYVFIHRVPSMTIHFAIYKFLFFSHLLMSAIPLNS